MKKTDYILICISMLVILMVQTVNAQLPDLKLVPIKEEMWVQHLVVTDEDTFCNYSGLPIGEYTVFAIPTILMNPGHADAIYGYPGDGYIEAYHCGGAYSIDSLQGFVIREYCTGNIVAVKYKGIFALQDNARPFYYDNRTGAITRYYQPSVVNALLEEHEIPDSARLAMAGYFSDTTHLGLQFTSIGAGDKYRCVDGNGTVVDHLEVGFYYVDLILTPPPSLVEDTFWSNTYTWLIYYDEDTAENYYVKWGDQLPPLPDCCETPACYCHQQFMPAVPANVTVDASTKTITCESVDTPCHYFVTRWYGWKQGNHYEWRPHWGGVSVTNSYNDYGLKTGDDLQADIEQHFDWFGLPTRGRRKGYVAYTMSAVNSYYDFNLQSDESGFSNFIQP